MIQKITNQLWHGNYKAPDYAICYAVTQESNGLCVWKCTDVQDYPVYQFERWYEPHEKNEAIRYAVEKNL